VAYDGKLPTNPQGGGDLKWATFPENVPVKLVVDKAIKDSDDDNKFKLLCTVLDGTEKDKKTTIRMQRFFPSGDWIQSTIDFLATLCPDKFQNEDPIWSYHCVGKVFQCIPYKNKRGYWEYGSIELRGDMGRGSAERPSTPPKNKSSAPF
jgi:hypothetical protein